MRWTTFTRLAAHAEHVGQVLADAELFAEPAPTAEPSRDDVARLIEPHLWSPIYSGFRNFGDHRPQEEILEEERERARTKADSFLALLPGRTEAEVKAEALREDRSTSVRRSAVRKSCDPLPVRLDPSTRVP